jgi:uncharacterized protein (DUF2267 family)
VNYDDFINVVQAGARASREAAEQASRAVLEVLAERIASGEARDLAAALPPGIAPWLATTSDAERFDADEFVRRVAEREGADVEKAERHVRAVLDAVSRAVSDKEFSDLIAELSKDYARLLPKGPAVEAVSSETFLERVADRTGLPFDRLEPAVDAVLETLAERIAGGEVDDLIARLPPRLHEPLMRGKAGSGGKAQPLSLDEFIRRVGERAELDPDQARDAVRGVMQALHETVGDKEYRDIIVELPSDFRALLAPPPPAGDGQRRRGMARGG